MLRIKQSRLFSLIDWFKEWWKRPGYWFPLPNTRQNPNRISRSSTITKSRTDSHILVLSLL